MGTREEVGRDIPPIIPDGRPHCSPATGSHGTMKMVLDRARGSQFHGSLAPRGPLGWDPYGLANLAGPGPQMEPGLGGGSRALFPARATETPVSILVSDRPSLWG